MNAHDINIAFVPQPCIPRYIPRNYCSSETVRETPYDSPDPTDVLPRI